jgi:hypothetical protein
MISDAIVIGVVLGLVFAAIAYYLYSRNTQLERKVGLMENILLDLKVTTEQALISATEAPEGPTTSHGWGSSEHSHAEFIPTSEEGTKQVNVETPRSSRPSTQTVVVERESSPNYEAMTYKQLMAVAKEKGVTGTRNVSKAHLIDLIRNHDAGGAPQPDTLDAHLQLGSDEGASGELTSALDAVGGEMGTLLEASEVTDVDASLVQ